MKLVIFVWILMLALCRTQEAPKNLVLLNAGITSLSFKWDPPDDFNYSTDNYYIVLTQGDSLTYVPAECNLKPDAPFSTTVSDQSYIYEWAKTYYSYQISVSVSRDGQNGEAAEINVDTAKGHGTEELNKFNYKNQTIIDDSNVELHGTLEWTYPCRPNADVTNFVISLKGVYTEDDSMLSSDEIIVKPEEKYELSSDISTYLKYSYSYDATIKVRNEVGESQKSNSVSFKTDPNYPDVPEDIKIEEVGDIMTIVWNEPSAKVGKIVNYTVVITPIGAGEGDIDCNPHTETITAYTLERSYSQTIHAYYDYKIAISAFTQVGQGKPAEQPHTTQVYYPEKVANFQCQLQYNNDPLGNYDVKAMGSFEEPCRFNGHFKHYEVKCSGIRDNYPPDDLTSAVLQDDSKTFEFSLKPDYSYNCTVTVLTEEYESDGDYEIIQAPAGVPVINDDVPIEEATLKKYNQAVFVLRNDYFTEDNGNNIFYAIIISNQEISSAEGFQYWDGSTWPQLDVNITTYITQEKWNPFAGGDDHVNVEISNLKENMEYFLVIRAFTSAAYRDSANTKFKTGTRPTDDDNDNGSTNWGMIGGIIGGVSALLLVIGVLYTLWKKGKLRFNKAPKEEITIKSVEISDS